MSIVEPSDLDSSFTYGEFYVSASLNGNKICFEISSKNGNRILSYKDSELPFWHLLTLRSEDFTTKARRYVENGIESLLQQADKRSRTAHSVDSGVTYNTLVSKTSQILLELVKTHEKKFEYSKKD